MTLAIAATPTGTYDSGVSLAVTGASAVLSTKYTANWSASVDSWAFTAHSGHIGAGVAYLGGSLLADLAYSDEETHRTISSLTVAHRYRARATIAALYHPALLYMNVTGGVAGDAVPAGVSSGIADYVEVTYEWVATASSHVLEIHRADNSDQLGNDARIQVLSLEVTEIPLTGIGVLVQRTDANGTHYVRQSEGALPDSSGNQTIVDEEAALIGVVSWTVRDAVGTLATTTLTFTTDDYPLPLLSAVGYPGQVVQLARVSGYEEAREFGEASTVLAVIGRADPLVTSREDFAWGLRRGTLTYYAADYATAQAVVDLYTDGRITLLRQPTHPGLDLYHVGGRIRVTPGQLTGQGWRWAVDVDYAETGWPEGVLAGSAGWSWQDVIDNYLAWYNLPVEFATWADLTAGP